MPLLIAPVFAFQSQELFLIAVAATAVGLACVAVLKLNEKNMQEIEANQKQITALADRINELSQSQGSGSETKIDSKD
jgi:ABC-type thiamine transport system ATPase subunit